MEPSAAIDPVVWECELSLNTSFPLREGGNFDLSTQDLREEKQLLLTKMSSSTEHIIRTGRVSGELKPSCRRLSMKIEGGGVGGGVGGGDDVSSSLSSSWSLSGNALHISPHTQYYIAAFEKGGMKRMLMSRPHSIFSIQPTLSHLDEEDAKIRSLAKVASPTSSSTGSGTGSNQSTPDLKAVHMQFRKKETEEQQNARLCSHAHLNRLVDEELGEAFEYIADDVSESLFLKEKELSNAHK